MTGPILHAYADARDTGWIRHDEFRDPSWSVGSIEVRRDGPLLYIAFGRLQTWSRVTNGIANNSLVANLSPLPASLRPDIGHGYLGNPNPTWWSGPLQINSTTGVAYLRSTDYLSHSGIGWWTGVPVSTDWPV